MYRRIQIKWEINQSSTSITLFALDMDRMPCSLLSFVASHFQQNLNDENESSEPLKYTSVKFMKKLKANLMRPGNIILSEEQQRVTANTHRRPEKFTVGDKVLIQATALLTLSVQTSRPKFKLDLMFEGLFTITKLVGNKTNR